MPKKPAVPHPEMANAIMLAKDDILDERGCIPGPTAEVWRQLASKLENRVTPRYIYQYCKENRHNIHSILGLSQPPGNSTSSPVYSTSPASMIMQELQDTDEEVDCEIQPERTFSITFTSAEWRTIQPVEAKYKVKGRMGIRIRKVLPPNSWADILINKLWQSHKIPCPYSFTRGQVSCGEDTEYIKIHAKCKECGAFATGVVLLEPVDGEDVTLSWRAPDTRKVPHHRTRWLSGETRKRVGRELKRNCASVFRRELAFLNMEQGDLKPPTLWSSDVLRKAKQEGREEELGTKGPSSPVLNLVQLKYSPRYAGILHDIGLDKFFVHYYSPSQLLLYKKHVKSNYVKLSVDATGTLVKKISHTPDRKSGHIFLYEGVLTAVSKAPLVANVNLPVCQMLSEKHDTNTIIYWLNEWRRAGAPVPHEVVVDNSSALKSAVARVFTGMELKMYIEKCFSYCKEGKGQLPNIFIRLDVAHFINAACRWHIWADTCRKRIKEFYLRCLGILVNAQTFLEYEARFRDILIVALSPCQADRDGKAFPMQESLSCLGKVMTGREDSMQTPESVHTDRSRLLLDLGDMEVESSPKISQWIADIKNSIATNDDPEGQLNPYYLPEVAKEFSRLSLDFVLWSSVLTRAFASPFIRGTSSPVESSFSDLKCNILKGEAKPLKVDNFVATHITAIEGACRIGSVTFDSTNKALIKNLVPPQIDDSAAEELNTVENWRGLGAPKKSKYLTGFPGAELAVAAANFKAATTKVLQNGTGKPVTTSDGTMLLIKNTCPFDALCHLVANSYKNFESYRNKMTESENYFIRTAISLAHEGPTGATYAKRAETLASVLEPVAELPVPETRRRTLALEYDAFGNVGTLLKQMIPPHTSLTVMCEVEHHKKKHMLVDPNSKTLAEMGMVGLQQSVSNCGQRCSHCICTYGDHIFVDVEWLSDDSFPRDNSDTARHYNLNELPKQMSLGNETYQLSGVVSYSSFHYIAYCLSAGKWKKFDDLLPKEIAQDGTTKIWPSILMYVK